MIEVYLLKKKGDMCYETGQKFTVDQSDIRAISIHFSFNKLIPLTKTAFLR